MNVSSRRRVRPIALIGTVLLIAGGAVLVPTAANAATTNLTLDCATAPSSYSRQTMYVAPGDDYTFTLTGYGSVQDYATTSPHPVLATLDPAGDTYTVVSGQYVQFMGATTGTTTPCTRNFRVEVLDADPETVPSGSLLFTNQITIPLNAPELTVSAIPGSDHLLGGQSTCAVSTYFGGQHVYGTLNVTVLTAGTFTFRGMTSDPVGKYIPLQPYDPMGDPFLAVYKVFDPTQPDVGVVGCNDDLNDLGALHQAELFPDGSILDGHQPYFTAAMTPGNYTLVLMTYDNLSTADLAAGRAHGTGAPFVVGPKSTKFQLWGPTGALALRPSAPGTPTVVAGVGQASVSFTAPASDGGSPITSYTITSAPGGVATTCTASPCVVTGLTNGTAYTFTVHATNAIGESVESAASAAATTASLPGVPTDATATPGNAQASVSFTAPASNGGSPITSYTVTSAPGGVTATCTASPCVVTGLTNGTAYTFTVHATNAVGDSAELATSAAVTPVGAPRAPGTVTSSKTATSITVSFTAPDGQGSPITGYEYSTDNGVTFASLTTKSTGAVREGVITGLTPGSRYLITIRAVNAVGAGQSSATQAITTSASAVTAVNKSPLAYTGASATPLVIWAILLTILGAVFIIGRRRLRPRFSASEPDERVHES